MENNLIQHPEDKDSWMCIVSSGPNLFIGGVNGVSEDGQFLKMIYPLRFNEMMTNMGEHPALTVSMNKVIFSLDLMKVIDIKYDFMYVMRSDMIDNVRTCSEYERILKAEMNNSPNNRIVRPSMGDLKSLPRN